MGVPDILIGPTHKAAGVHPAAFYFTHPTDSFKGIGEQIMTDPYLYVMLHKSKHLERVKEAEQDRLVQFVTPRSVQMQALMELSKGVLIWWKNRYPSTPNTHAIEGKVVLP